ncbi:carbohydrate kinase family protein [Trueperella bernardiae]|uniref:Carbohydrate kinase family protein n=1 Tax=Trueperella bernardiae TaxID=59561 RepID=A0AAW6ZJN2_9ACTO|nr:carbohydrate kinase family protein [Trueperella bernardiae]MDK8601889.1 carbohydrate kinase family protein [Trueperella bernardiae]PKZ88566.1 carbohydrate kinase family protein [Trueperella bernardiae]WIM07912.1 carbohydrate kinase family protein [Trueperella bernardiae]
MGEKAEVVANVVAAGPLFLDVVQFGLEHAPRPGEEQWVAGGAVMAGGVANQAIACARLGLNVDVVTNVGADRAGRWVAEVLAEEGVGLAGSTRGGTQSVTVAQVLDGDRAFTTYGDGAYPDLPAGLADAAPGFVVASVDYLARNLECLKRLRGAGTVVVADTAWDPTGRWDRADLDPLAQADIFVPNAAEALAYTRAGNVREAARRLLELVPTVVVTCGGDGVVIASRPTCVLTRDHALGGPAGASAGGPGALVIELPAIDVEAKDTTGAGDSFTAGLVRALARGAKLLEAVVLGQVVAGWTVQRLGGSAAAPTRADLREWAVSGQLRWALPTDTAGPGEPSLGREPEFTGRFGPYLRIYVDEVEIVPQKSARLGAGPTDWPTIPDPAAVAAAYAGD